MHTARARRELPPETWTLALLYLAGGGALLLGAAVPFSPQAPVGVGQVLGPTAVAVGAGVLLAGRRLSARAQHLLLAGATLLIGVVVLTARTGAGAVLDGYAYFWVGAYAGHFLPRRAALWHVALVAVTFAIGLVPDRGFNVVWAWALVVGNVTAATLVWGGLVRRLAEHAHRDPLTGLLNRRGLREAATRELARARRLRLPITVAVADLDGLKQVNDRDGHAAGDDLLIRTAASWRAALRATDLLGREGGDEFVFVLPATTEAEAVHLLERLAHDSPSTWSAGVAVWHPGEDLHHATDRADAALYASKAARRGRALPRVTVAPRAA